MTFFRAGLEYLDTKTILVSRAKDTRYSCFLKVILADFDLRRKLSSFEIPRVYNGRLFPILKYLET